MLHASIRAVGPVAGGPDQIHLALRDALTDAGTMMMYLSCPQYYDEVGRGHLTAELEREILDKLPAFDARTARAARDNGALAELFRTWPGTLMNDHVARFGVWGAHAQFLVRRGRCFRDDPDFRDLSQRLEHDVRDRGRCTRG